MSIGVAIVTYNSAADIAQCVESVRSEGLLNIAIVDSGSQDATMKEIAHQGCKYDASSMNKGFGYSANRGARLLNTEYVLFINPDARLQKGSVERIRMSLQKFPNAGIIGLLLCDENGTPERMAFGDEPTLWALMLRHVFLKKIPSIPFNADWVSGGAFIMQKKVFDEVGGFDENFFMYWEDVDLCRRVRKKGYSVIMDPTAKVTHFRGGSNLDSDTKTRVYRESADRYFKKHYSSTIWRIQRFLRKLQ
ncbi:MAG: glycosyltransferase family 2 protein [bacterium]|nr:glycosyltransferase family 2 protein [bacterium]